MSEWQPTEKGASREWLEEPWELAAYAHDNGSAIVWCEQRLVLDVGVATDLDGAKEACDAAAVAWVLISLAKRAAAWADTIDAQFVREYRAASTVLHEELAALRKERDYSGRALLATADLVTRLSDEACALRDYYRESEAHRRGSRARSRRLRDARAAVESLRKDVAK